MKFIVEFWYQYRLLRRGDACRQACASDGQQNAYSIGRRPSCDECANTGYKNGRTRIRAFLGAFRMLKFARGFRKGIIAFETDDTPDLFAEMRRQKQRMRILRALELYRHTNSKAEIQDFNALDAQTRRDYIQRANLPIVEDICIYD
jgi:hypothetical protein